MMLEGNSLIIQILHLRRTVQIRELREVVHKRCAAIDFHTIDIRINLHEHLYAVMERQKTEAVGWLRFI